MNKPLNITFDTNIFDENNFDLSENSTLSQLIKYVQQGDITVFLSNIVIGEMKAHCQEYARLISSKIRKTRNDIQQGILSNDKTKEYHKVSDNFVEAIGYSYILTIPDKKKSSDLALNYLDRFLTSLRTITLDSATVNVDGIFSDYFYKKPPFEESEKKKSEFPDAVIAAQIKNNFSDKEPIYIVTKDNGLKKALQDISYCTIVSSLAELYQIIIDKTNEYKERLAEAQDIINSKIEEIKRFVNDDLDDESKITLSGMEYDKDGISSGYDYDEIYFTEHHIDDLKLFVIDHFDDNSIIARLRCIAYIEAECSYDDYENAVWDSEDKEYMFLDRVTIVEKHQVRFAIRVVIDRNNDNSVESFNFHVFLGGDSRLDRYEMKEDSQEDEYCNNKLDE